MAWCKKGPRLQKRVYLENGVSEKFDKNMYGSQIILANFFYFMHFSIVNQINDDLSMFLKKIGLPPPLY